MPTSPTIPPPAPDSLSGALRRNIDALRRRREDEEASASFEERLAERITSFGGSMRFVYAHAAIYGLWILANLGVLPGIGPWDPTFVVLAMIASVEAIFLSTFVMISQNRADARRQVIADQQWKTVQEEDKQNEELLDLSRQILSLTKEVRSLAGPDGGTGLAPANKPG